MQSTLPYPIPVKLILILPAHLRLGLPTCLLPSDLPTKVRMSNTPTALHNLTVSMAPLNIIYECDTLFLISPLSVNHFTENIQVRCVDLYVHSSIRLRGVVLN
jgi:hypothetical protein